MATPHCLRHHVGVFRSVPAYMHRAMVVAYVRDATFAPLDGRAWTVYPTPCIFMRWHKMLCRLPVGRTGRDVRIGPTGTTYTRFCIRSSQNSPSTHSAE